MPARAHSMEPRPATSQEKPPWLLRLFAIEKTPKALRARENPDRICEEYLAVPTPLRRRPPPVLRVVGDLSSTKKVLAVLDPKGAWV